MEKEMENRMNFMYVSQPGEHDFTTGAVRNLAREKMMIGSYSESN